jgi:creatinine amidohydrolase/Fe(II)-dependent formamide hydrolase-like protein
MTSTLLLRRSEALRPDCIRDQASDEPDWSDPHLDFSAFSSTAVVGSAAHASLALGEPLWHACVKAVGDMLRLIDIDP